MCSFLRSNTVYVNSRIQNLYISDLNFKVHNVLSTFVESPI